MVVDCYAVGMLPLVEHMRVQFEVLQAWFADDFEAGTTPDVGAAMMLELQRKGPSVGYYISPPKSYFVCEESEELHAAAVFEEAGLEILFMRLALHWWLRVNSG